MVFPLHAVASWCSRVRPGEKESKHSRGVNFSSFYGQMYYSSPPVRSLHGIYTFIGTTLRRVSKMVYLLLSLWHRDTDKVDGIGSRTVGVAVASTDDRVADDRVGDEGAGRMAESWFLLHDILRGLRFMSAIRFFFSFVHAQSLHEVLVDI